MNLAKLSLILTAIIYALIGIIFLSDPIYWGSSVDISLPTPTAIIDLRATYGGCMLAIGFFLLYCLKNSKLIRVGLIFQAISLGGFAFGRSLGIILNGTPRPIMFYLLAAEIFGVALGIFCLRQLNKTEKI